MQSYTVFTKEAVVDIVADVAEMDDDGMLTFRMNDGEVVGVFSYPEGFALSAHLGEIDDRG